VESISMEKIINSEISKKLLLLYHIPGLRSTRVAWLLNELSVLYEESEELKKKGMSFLKTEEFLKISPQGTVPTIVDGDVTLFESGAIIKYLLRKFSKQVEQHGLVPKEWTTENMERNDLYSHWCIATIDHRVYCSTDLSTIPTTGITRKIGRALTSKDREWWKRCAFAIAYNLGNYEYINGNTFTITDIYLGYSLAHVHNIGWLKESPINVQQYYARIQQREGFKRAIFGTNFDF
jgi:glutathione S-transferase